MEKADKHLSENDTAVIIKTDTPFALAMRFGRYLKAFREQMKNREEVDECKYDMLKITHDDKCVRISHALEIKQLELFDEETGGKLE